MTISKTYDLVWQYSESPNYQFTQDGKCFNVLRNKEIKKTLVGGSVGFCLNGTFKSTKSLKGKLIKLTKEKAPF